MIRKLLLLDKVKHEIIMPRKLKAGDPIKRILNSINNLSNSIWRAIIIKGIRSSSGTVTVSQCTTVLRKRMISKGKSESK